MKAPTADYSALSQAMNARTSAISAGISAQNASRWKRRDELQEQQFRLQKTQMGVNASLGFAQLGVQALDKLHDIKVGNDKNSILEWTESDKADTDRLVLQTPPDDLEFETDEDGKLSLKTPEALQKRLDEIDKAGKERERKVDSTLRSAVRAQTEKAKDYAMTQYYSKHGEAMKKAYDIKADALGKTYIEDDIRTGNGDSVEIGGKSYMVPYSYRRFVETLNYSQDVKDELLIKASNMFTGALATRYIADQPARYNEYVGLAASGLKDYTWESFVKDIQSDSRLSDSQRTELLSTYTEEKWNKDVTERKAGEALKTGGFSDALGILEKAYEDGTIDLDDYTDGVASLTKMNNSNIAASQALAAADADRIFTPVTEGTIPLSQGIAEYNEALTSAAVLGMSPERRNAYVKTMSDAAGSWISTYFSKQIDDALLSPDSAQNLLGILEDLYGNGRFSEEELAFMRSFGPQVDTAISRAYSEIKKLESLWGDGKVAVHEANISKLGYDYANGKIKAGAYIEGIRKEVASAESENASLGSNGNSNLYKSFIEKAKKAIDAAMPKEKDVTGKVGAAIEAMGSSWLSVGKVKDMTPDQQSAYAIMQTKVIAGLMDLVRNAPEKYWDNPDLLLAEIDRYKTLYDETYLTFVGRDVSKATWTKDGYGNAVAAAKDLFSSDGVDMIRGWGGDITPEPGKSYEPGDLEFLDDRIKEQFLKTAKGINSWAKAQFNIDLADGAGVMYGSDGKYYLTLLSKSGKEQYLYDIESASLRKQGESQDLVPFDEEEDADSSTPDDKPPMAEEKAALVFAAVNSTPEEFDAYVESQVESIQKTEQIESPSIAFQVDAYRKLADEVRKMVRDGYIITKESMELYSRLNLPNPVQDNLKIVGWDHETNKPIMESTFKVPGYKTPEELEKEFQMQVAKNKGMLFW